MATTLADLAHAGTKRAGRRQRGHRLYPAALVTALTGVAFAVHGYHPYAEDGGLYMAGVKYLLDPRLYPHGTAFVTEHLRYSLFAPLVADLVRAWQMLSGGSGLQGLDGVLPALHLASLWTTLFAMWLLAGRCYRTIEARAGAVVLLACWLGLPVAGTSLLLMDPYVTARSLSTPCILLALVGALELMRRQAFRPERGPGSGWGRAAGLCFGAIAGAALMHPLMAGYGLAGVLLLLCCGAERRSVRVWGTLALCAAAVALAAAIDHAAAPDTDAYRQVATTRSYWFVARWRWYEIFGLAAPLAILTWAVWFWSPRNSEGRVELDRSLASRWALARSAAVAGAMAWLIASLFAHPDAANSMVARMQPLRMFQMTYGVMILILGAALGERLLQRKLWRWVAAVVFLGGVMFWAERVTYPASDHLEIGWDVAGHPPRNEWLQAFLWVRANTSKDALFALDADYIAAKGEDAQGFRAAAERSALPDYSKDGGEASISPGLTQAWVAGQAAQRDLSRANDAERIATLRPLGVSWVVMQASASTGFPCPYRNEAVMICKVPAGLYTAIRSR